MVTYERGLELATGERAPALRGAADMHVGMSELFIEWDDLALAEQHLVASQDLGEHAALAQNPYRWCAAMSHLRLIQGDVDGALALLDEAERRYVSEYYPDVRPIAALRARIWASHGRVADAFDWTRERGLSIEDDLSYLREFEHITLARILTARRLNADAGDSSGAAASLLQRLLAAAEEGGRTRSVIEILTLQALSLDGLGEVPAALAPLSRALALAQPEGYVRIFVDEGPPMAALLEAAAKDGVAVEYVHRLLAAQGRTRSTSAQQALAEPLSRRELDVLRLLATELDGPAIASQLFVGVSTIRSHTKSIYAKLGVNNRRAAVRRSEELGLLSRASSG
jgi:LuxR family maltose regulon positive regulatory protein